MAMLRTRRLCYGVLNTLERRVYPEPYQIAGTLYVCPEGVRAIVREARYFVTASGTPDAITTWQVWRGAGGIPVQESRVQYPTIRSHVDVMDLVLEAGDEWFVSSLHSELKYYVTGAELPLGA